MKTTLTLEDVERLEKLLDPERGGYLDHKSMIGGDLLSLLPLILPVIRGHVQGNPEGLRPPVQASLDQGPDVPANLGIQCSQCGLIHQWSDREGSSPTQCPRCLSAQYVKFDGAASQKTAQEGSVCEVEPLGEVTPSLEEVMDMARKELCKVGTQDRFVSGFVSGWLRKSESSPPSSEDTELLDWLEDRKLGVYTMTHPIECGPNPEFVFDGWAVGYSVDPRMSLRQAIRAARTKEAQASTTSQKGALV